MISGISSNLVMDTAEIIRKNNAAKLSFFSARTNEFHPDTLISPNRILRHAKAPGTSTWRRGAGNGKCMDSREVGGKKRKMTSKCRIH